MPSPPVERVEVLILVDNSTDILSSSGRDSEGELARSLRRGAKSLSSRCLCCAVHGFACIVTAYRGDQRESVLFDSGPESYAFVRNVERLGVDLGQIGSIVLSHGHWDHVGAISDAIRGCLKDTGRRSVPVFAHPDMFQPRGMRMKGGDVLPMDDVPSIIELEAFGARVVSTREAISDMQNLFYLSGEIPRNTEFEKGLPGHVRRTSDGTDWEPDEEIRDERWLGVNVEGKGVVVLTACSHAGVVNVCQHAQSVFGSVPVYSVIGGLHLAGATEMLIPQTVSSLGSLGLKMIAPGHCTGWRGTAALREAFGEAVVSPTAVGKRYIL
jgi:7,8-dihydropterin-6-yl-methyl-4-(beta-D-ribofuranosyl)aminobenzene 5'-phosphate synthase